MCYSQFNSIGDKRANGLQSTRTVAESMLAYCGGIKGDGYNNRKGAQRDLPLDV